MPSSNPEPDKSIWLFLHLLKEQPPVTFRSLLSDWDAQLGRLTRLGVLVARHREPNDYQAYSEFELAPRVLKYFSSMVSFFQYVTDPTDLDQLTNRPNPYSRTMEATAHLSGPNDRRTDDQGNDFWVEKAKVFD